MSGRLLEVVWCHHCGTFTFADEWGESPWALGPDICPVCDECFPPTRIYALSRFRDVPRGLTPFEAAEQRVVAYG